VKFNEKKKIYLILLTFLFFNTAYFKLNISNVDQQNIDNNYQPILSDVNVGNFTVPGISVPIPISQVIKIGILDDMKYITGEHAWNGAILAAKEINQAGGVLLNGTIHYVGLVAEDTDEANPNLEILDGILAATKMVSYDPHYIIGGFCRESLHAYQEVIMDAKIPFLCTGCPSDVFCENVYINYNRYKYFFRASPINGTSLARELISYFVYLTSFLKAVYGQDAGRFGILREDLSWTSPIANILKSNLPLLVPNYSLELEVAYPISAVPTDFNSYLSMFEAAGAQIVIPLISGPTGAHLGAVYGQMKLEYLLCGINYMSQSDTYWNLTAGGGRYEITMQSAYRTNKTPQTIPFWDAFLAEYNKEPIFTGIGSYDAVRMLAYVTSEVQSFNADIIVSELEQINQSNPFAGVSGNIAFTETHDLLEGWPYATELFCQWQMDGNKVVLSTGNLIYPDSIVTGSLSIPYWGIYNLVDDYSYKLPGDFSLSSDADNPDPDGAFIINWTDSEGADYYTLYLSNSPITYVSKNHMLITNVTEPGEVPLSGLRTGEYFIAAVAYNGTGQKFSNNVQVTVQLPAPGNFTLSSDADAPDTDGAFNLIWTDSEGADNYSVYMFDKFITEINESLTLLANQTAISPFPISGLLNDEYYFTILAYNENGATMSDNEYIIVYLPVSNGDKIIIPGYSFILILSIGFIVSLLLVKNTLHKKIK